MAREQAIGRFLVGPGRPCFIIAEIGLNHQGSVDLAKRLVEAAIMAGADAVKIQMRSPMGLMSKDVAEQYWPKGRGLGLTQIDARLALELDDDDVETLIDACPVAFGISAFDPAAVDRAFGHGPDFLKVPSHAATNHPLLEQFAASGRPLIASTGALTDREVVLMRSVMPDAHYLHCVSQYPTPLGACDVARIRRLELDGYSSHEPGAAAVPAAVACGAYIVERHLTLSRTMVGPDHAISSEPDEFKVMVETIRRTEQVMNEARPMDCRRAYHVSWHALERIPARTEVKREQIWLCQPCPDRAWPGYTTIAGRRAVRDIEAGECIRLEDLE